MLCRLSERIVTTRLRKCEQALYEEHKTEWSQGAISYGLSTRVSLLLKVPDVSTVETLALKGNQMFQS